MKQIAVYSFLFFTTIWNLLGKKIVVAPRLNNMILMFSYENLNIHSINICPIGFVDSFECPTYSNWSKYNLERYDEVWQNELKWTSISIITDLGKLEIWTRVLHLTRFYKKTERNLFTFENSFTCINHRLWVLMSHMSPNCEDYLYVQKEAVAREIYN